MLLTLDIPSQSEADKLVPAVLQKVLNVFLSAKKEQRLVLYRPYTEQGSGASSCQVVKEQDKWSKWRRLSKAINLHCLNYKL